LTSVKRWLSKSRKCHSRGNYGRPIEQAFYFHPVVSSFFPRLLSSVTDWMYTVGYFHTSCGLIVDIWNAGLKCAARGWLKIQDAKNAKNSPSAHHRTTLSGYIFALRHASTIGKKLLNSNISSTCRHNMVNFGPLTAEIGWRVSGTPANFNGFRALFLFFFGYSQRSHICDSEINSVNFHRAVIKRLCRYFYDSRCRTGEKQRNSKFKQSTLLCTCLLEHV